MTDLEQEIDETRQHLGETVDALSAKLDVKGRAHDSFEQADKRKLGVIAAVGVAAVVGLVLWLRR